MDEKPGQRKADIVKAWLNGQPSGVSRQRTHEVTRSLFAIDGLSRACQQRGVGAEAVADVIADALQAERALVVPDGKGGATVRMVDDHTTRLKAASLLIDVELKLKQLEQTIEVEEHAVLLDGVDLAALGRDELTALVMRRSVRRATP